MKLINGEIIPYIAANGLQPINANCQAQPVIV